MDEFTLILRSLDARMVGLSPELKNLKQQLEKAFDKHMLEAGVINPGYYSHFQSILEQFRSAKIIDRYHIQEEQYDSNGRILKIPVVDLFSTTDNSNTRVFILSEAFVKSK